MMSLCSMDAQTNPELSSTARGDAFETRCLEVIKHAIANNKLGIIPEQARVFQKKGYRSSKREGNIVFDLSIEVWPEGAERPALLWLIECKDYSSPVPVNDIEEFYTKVDQVADMHRKSVVITSGPLQSGAMTFARNTHMMVIEVSENITYQIVLHKAKRFQADRQKSSASDMVNQVRGKWEDSIGVLLLRGFSEHVKETIPCSPERAVPILSADQIEIFCNALLNAIDEGILANGWGLRIERLIDFLKTTYHVEVTREHIAQVDSEGRPILSSCSFRERLIMVAPSLSQERYTFAIAHEAGHFLLHNKLVIGQTTYERMDDSTFNFRKGRNDLTNDRQWLEWQANRFATFLLLPKPSVYRQFAQQQGGGLANFRRLYVDSQVQNKKEFFRIVAGLSDYFKVSKQSLTYRLEELGLAEIKVPLGVASVSDVIRRMFIN